MDNCIINGRPMAEYQADKATPTPSLSKGTIQRILTETMESARLYHPRLGGEVEKKDDSKLDYHSAVHAMLLEGGNGIEIVAADDWRTKAAREARDAARAAGKFPILEHQHEKVATMAGVARKFIKDSILGNLMAEAGFEQSLYWQETHGIWCRARTDIMSNDYSLVVDLKGTEIASPEAFMRQMQVLGYDLQENFYKRGIRKITGIDPEWYFLVQQVKKPYSCYLVQTSTTMRELAERRVTRAINQWRVALNTDYWPGYDKTPYTAEATPWSIAQEEAAS